VTQDTNMTTEAWQSGVQTRRPGSTRNDGAGDRQRPCAAQGPNGWRSGTSTFTTAPFRQWPISI